MPSGRGQSSRSRTHRHARGGTDRQTAPAVGEGRAYRGAKVRRVSWRRRDGTTSHSAVRRAASPRGEGSPGARSSPAPRTGRAPLPGCRWVCPWVYGSPRLRAVPRRYPAAVQLSALPRAAPSAPPERQHRRAPGPGSERGAPEAHGARRPRSRPSPPLQAPFLRRPPTVLLLSLGAVPRPELRSLPRCARRRPRAAPRGLCGHLPRPACPRVSAPLWSLSF